MSATAGFCGPDIRGDCKVTITRDGRKTREVRSRVKALFGEALLAQIEEVLETLRAADLSVLLEDEGALPFTVGARIEAAAKRFDPSLTGDWLPKRFASVGVPPECRPRRTRLYLPGNTPKFFINAGLYGADAVILDLEDSVAPSEKDAARILVRNALTAVDFLGAERMVRINKGEHEAGDIVAVSGAETLILPKTETAEDVQRVDRLTGGKLSLIPLIESAKGVANAQEIAAASPRVVALSIGVEDYLADIGGEKTEGGAESLWALSQVVNAARAAGISPLGPVFPDFEDTAALERQVHRLAALGFEGFSCIHPLQVRTVHQGLMPSREEIEKAEHILSGFKGALASGQGAVSVDGTMVDAPVAKRAERILLRAGRTP